MGRVQGKVAVVTGGASGIGRATCLMLAKQGAKVAVTDVNDGLGQQIAEQIGRDGGKASFCHMDVSNEQDVCQQFAAIAESHGKVDILVNNAAIVGVDQPTHALSEQQWDAVFAVNAKGVFFCTKHAVAYMSKAGGGSIINVCSIYGLVGSGGVPQYHATKGAVAIMSRNHAITYGPDGIRVNSVHPGHIMTPLLAGTNSTPASRRRLKERLRCRYPLGHIGEPEDIAYGIVYLASDEARFVTGSQLVIDGGYTAQ